LHEITWEIVAFKIIFIKILKLGLPPPWDGNGDILPKTKYQEKLDNTSNNDNEFDNMEGVI
jgi:hypothetical protein